MSGPSFQLVLDWHSWSDAVDHLERLLPQPDVDFLSEAYRFAVACHGEQRRPNGDPYVRHLLDVVEILGRAGVRDRSILAAGLLHDVAEDTSCTLMDIRGRFGDAVEAIVSWVTLPLPEGEEGKAGARARYSARLEHAPPEAILVKLADRLSNVRDIGNYSTLQKRQAYYRETVARVLPLSGRYPWFAKEFAAWRDAFEDLA